MSTFAGIVTFDAEPIDGEIESRLIKNVCERRSAADLTRRATGAVFARGQAASPNTKGDLRIVADDGGRTLFAGFARLDNRDELATALQIPPPELPDWPDTVLLMRMLKRWGEAGVARCIGAFAFARWEADARRLILGRDCLGQRPLLFHHAGDFVVFSNTLGTVLAMPGVPREIDEIMLANFMVLNPRNPRRTLYRGIERTPSRSLVTIDRGGVRQRHYWSPDFDAPAPYQRDEDYIERARELFDQAVLSATSDSKDVAISSTGGLDSSAIAATVARLGRAERITCYTSVNPVDYEVEFGSLSYSDERPKMEALARMYPALHLRFLAQTGLHAIDEDATRLFARTNLPVLGPIGRSRVEFLFDAVKAGGHSMLLMGGLGNIGLSWNGDGSLRALFAAAQWRRFALELAAVARSGRRGVTRTLMSEVVLPGMAAPLRRPIYRMLGRDPDDPSRYSALNPEFIAAHDLVQHWHEQGFDPAMRMTGWQPARWRAQFLFDRHHAHFDSISWLENAHEPEVRDPHADRRLLEFLLSVPEPLYRRNGIPRSFARAVLADRLPQEILAERRRGASGGAWFRRLCAQRHVIAAEVERLESSPMARRLIDLPRLKRLLDQWPRDEQASQQHLKDYKLVLARGAHIGRFIRWVEGGNA